MIALRSKVSRYVGMSDANKFAASANYHDRPKSITIHNRLVNTCCIILPHSLQAFALCEVMNAAAVAEKSRKEEIGKLLGVLSEKHQLQSEVDRQRVSQRRNIDDNDEISMECSLSSDRLCPIVVMISFTRRSSSTQ